MKNPDTKNGAPAVIIPGACYTSPEAAELLRVKVSTICRAKRQGKINAAGRPLRIMGSELIRFALAGGTA
jgi:hypothetical protein